jgi:hypothetical protein
MKMSHEILNYCFSTSGTLLWEVVHTQPTSKTKLHGLESASKLYRPSDRRLSAK